MWSYLKSLINKISGKKPVETQKTAPSFLTKSETEKDINRAKDIAKAEAQAPAKSVLPAQPKEKAPEAKPAKTIKQKEITAPKKKITVKPQEKLPEQSSFIDVPVTKPEKISPEKSEKKALPNWKEQADAAEKIKRAFQGFFYDIASLENLKNQPDTKKTNFENYKKSFKTKLDQNLPKLELLDQQILQHISNNILNKDIKDITENLEKQTMEQVSKIPEKYIN